jgi:hypothetical protein
VARVDVVRVVPNRVGKVDVVRVVRNRVGRVAGMRHGHRKQLSSQPNRFSGSVNWKLNGATRRSTSRMFIS